MGQHGVASPRQIDAVHAAIQFGTGGDAHGRLGSQILRFHLARIVVVDAERTDGRPHQGPSGRPHVQPFEGVSDLHIGAEVGQGGQMDRLLVTDFDFVHGTLLRFGEGGQGDQLALPAIGRRRDAEGVAEGPVEGGNAAVAGPPGHLDHRPRGLEQVAGCPMQADAPHRLGHRFAGHVAKDAMEVVRRETSHRGQLLHVQRVVQMRGHVGDDPIDPAHVFQ